MAYRDFTLPDGRKVRTRISDKGTLEWYRDREELVGRGYPDRPPDIDTEAHRAWVEPGTAITRRKYEGGGVSSYPIAHYVWSGALLPELKIMISWLMPGDAYYLRMKLESSGFLSGKGSTLLDAERYFTADQTDALNAFIEENLSYVNDQMGAPLERMGLTPEWVVSPPGDAVEMESLVEQAEADHEQEFADEWAEARRLSKAGSGEDEAAAGTSDAAHEGQPDPAVPYSHHSGRRLH